MVLVFYNWKVLVTTMALASIGLIVVLPEILIQTVPRRGSTQALRKPKGQISVKQTRPDKAKAIIASKKAIFSQHESTLSLQRMVPQPQHKDVTISRIGETYSFNPNNFLPLPQG